MRTTSSSSMSLQRLRWLTIIIPVVVLALFGIFHGLIFSSRLSLWMTIAVAFGIIFTGSYSFSQWVFSIIERLDSKTHRQAERSRALVTISQEINRASLDTKAILQCAVDLSRNHLAASLGEIHYMREGHEHGVRFSGLTLGSCPVKELPTLSGLSGEVLRTGSVVRLDNRLDHPLSVGKLPEGHPSTGPVLGVPILVKGEVMADLWLIRPAGDPPFTQEEEEFLQTVSHLTAVAFENAQLYEDIAHMAVLEERDRLGREIHDGLAQTLGYLNLRLRTASDRTAVGDTEKTAAILQETRQVVRDAYEEVRCAIFDLRIDVVRSELEFLPALEEYLYEFGLQGHLETTFKAPENCDLYLSSATEVQLVRIMQEALANVRKHAGASRVFVRMEPNGNHCRVIIEDDGHGFLLQKSGQNGDGRPHFGLQTMRERAESIGGQFSIESTPDKGTRVTVKLPFDSHYERILDEQRVTSKRAANGKYA